MDTFDTMHTLQKHLYERSLSQTLAKNIQNFRKRPNAFGWIHAGKVYLPFGSLLELLNKQEKKPLRTGHIGDWYDIMQGHSGSLDYNGIVCRRGWGRPYIYELTQTENSQLTSGDTLYFPASRIRKGIRERLPLWHYRDGTFQEADPDKSYFVPFMQCNNGNSLISVSEFQKKSGEFPDDSLFTCSLFVDNLNSIQQLLLLLFDALEQGKIQLSLRDLIDRAVTLGGEVARITLIYKEGVYYIGDIAYGDKEALAAYLLVAFIAGDDFTAFAKQLDKLPSTLPLLSLSAISALSYVILNKEDTNLVTHIEWGAFSSAGCPPLHKGYYRKKSSKIGLIYKSLCQVGRGRVSEFGFPKLFFVLLPSGVLNLLPSAGEPSDMASLTALFSSIVQEKVALKDIQQRGPHILQTVKQWYNEHSNNLSLYFKQRFGKTRRVLGAYKRGGGASFIPDPFYELSTQQLSMILGSLLTMRQNEETCHANHA